MESLHFSRDMPQEVLNSRDMPQEILRDNLMESNHNSRGMPYYDSPEREEPIMNN